MRHFSLNINGELRQFDRPSVMGILNVTPDSFYAGSRALSDKEIAVRVEKIIAEGADIIDVGACSTRPGSTPASIEDEKIRLGRALKIVRQFSQEILVSVDTFRSEIARMAVAEYGCNIINDVSGGEFDPDMFAAVASLKVPYVLTHGNRCGNEFHVSRNGSTNVASVLRELHAKLSELYLLGVADIIIDPGFGFSKTVRQNYEIVKNLEIFSVLKHPVLVGVSRKRMVTELLELTPDDALAATTALNAFCLANGAAILRVHDVKEACQTVNIYNAVNFPETLND